MHETRFAIRRQARLLHICVCVHARPAARAHTHTHTIRNLRIESSVHTFEDNAQRVDALPRSASSFPANAISPCFIPWIKVAQALLLYFYRASSLSPKRSPFGCIQREKRTPLYARAHMQHRGDNCASKLRMRAVPFSHMVSKPSHSHIIMTTDQTDAYMPFGILPLPSRHNRKFLR